MKTSKLLSALLLLSAWSLPAQTFNVLHNFTNTPDGEMPAAGLVFDQGMLYGVSAFGGSSDDGTLFKVSTNGTGYTVLKTFTYSSDYTDGSMPEASLIAADGVLFGTTLMGGSNSYGTVFRISTNGTGYQILHHFGAEVDGRQPYGKLCLDNGILYGGVGSGGISNYGAIFRISTEGTGYSVLMNFSETNGWAPQGNLVMYNGVLYGTTAQGGPAPGWMGEVFSMNTDGTGFTVLKSFNSSGTDGYNPQSDIIVTNGVIYGTTDGGGGTVFKMNTNGTGFTTLKAFGYYTDGNRPWGGLALVGNTLYGTCNEDGTHFDGNVYRINVDGTGFFPIYNFSGADGNALRGDVIWVDGTLYGTSYSGGSASDGVVFSLVPPPPGPAAPASHCGGW
ncbi:conserved exported hypothetical protein [Verrucomicrobia bacterium]|nr:conserved exported hypothetical protein [Verrucomicrobiota bacterium]